MCFVVFLCMMMVTEEVKNVGLNWCIGKTSGVFKLDLFNLTTLLSALISSSRQNENVLEL